MPETAWLRRLVVTLGPLEEWRGATAGQTVRFASDGTPGGLRIACEINKIIQGQPEKSRISLYNLSAATRAAIRVNLSKITVHAGWQSSETQLVFQGSLHSVYSQREGAEVVTLLAALPGHGAEARGVSARTFPAGTTLNSAVSALAADLPGVSLRAENLVGLDGQIGYGGWSFAGPARDALNRLAGEYGFSWHIDNGEFKAVGDKAVFSGTTRLDAAAGTLFGVVPIVSGPDRDNQGVRLTALYTPGVVPGALVEVASLTSPNLNGEYRVNACKINLDTYAAQWTQILDAFRPKGGGQ